MPRRTHQVFEVRQDRTGCYLLAVLYEMRCDRQHQLFVAHSLREGDISYRSRCKPLREKRIQVWNSAERHRAGIAKLQMPKLGEYRIRCLIRLRGCDELSHSAHQIIEGGKGYRVLPITFPKVRSRSQWSEVFQVPAQPEIIRFHGVVSEHGLRDDMVKLPVLTVVWPVHPVLKLTFQMALEISKGIRKIPKHRLAIFGRACRSDGLMHASPDVPTKLHPWVPFLAVFYLRLDFEFILLVILPGPLALLVSIGRAPLPGVVLSSLPKLLILRVPPLALQREPLHYVRACQIPGIGLKYGLTPFLGLVPVPARLTGPLPLTFYAVQGTIEFPRLGFDIAEVSPREFASPAHKLWFHVLILHSNMINRKYVREDLERAIHPNSMASCLNHGVTIVRSLPYQRVTMRRTKPRGL